MTMQGHNTDSNKKEGCVEVTSTRTMYETRVRSRDQTPGITVPTASDMDAPVISHNYCERSRSRDYDAEKAMDDIDPGADSPPNCDETKENRVLEINDPERPTASITEIDDTNCVDWCEQDPGHPQNWKRSRKWTAIAIVSAFTFMSPVASSILAPSLKDIGEDLNIQSESERSLCLSIFVLGFAFGPLILAPLSEVYGRTVTLQWSHVLFFIFNGACGFARTKEQLIAFRFFGGIGGSAPLALGPGVLSDLFSADERGLSAGIYSFFPILGPAIGPICGGFIADYGNWRWGFWGTTIADVPILVLGVIFLEETYAPVLLRRRKQKLTRETGNEALFTRDEDPSSTFANRIRQAMLRPMKLMGTQVIIIVMGLYQAYLYGLMYIVLTTFPKLWTESYHQSPSMAGLNYISLGIGYCVGVQLSAYIQDAVYRIFKRRNNGVDCPEFRVPLLLPVAVLLPIGFFTYGWTAEYHTHWIFPNIGAFIFAAGIMVGFNALMTYVVDCYTTYSASAAAATAVLRSVAAFLFPLFAPSMYEAMGSGWGNSLLAFLALGIGGPAPVLLWYHGAKLRAKSQFCSG